MPFDVRTTELPGVLLVTPQTFADERGWFSESYKSSEFAAAGIPTAFLQDNVSSSTKRGTLRGMHFQRAPFAQGKLVRCLQGRVLDVVVDLRRGSPTERRAAAFELDAAAGTMVWVPTGFAHGFQTLVDDCLVLYKTTAEYSPAHEVGIRWDDPALALAWPIRPAILSPRDAALPGLADATHEFAWSGG